MPSITLPARSTGTYTGGTIANAETVTVCGKVYTFQTTLTDVDGNVNLGADDVESVNNLVAAINLSNEGESAVGPDNDYALAMTVNPHCVAVADGETPNVATFTAKVGGLIGNFLPLAETSGGSISGALFTGGTGNIYTAIDQIIDGGQMNADVIATLDLINANAGQSK